MEAKPHAASGEGGGIPTNRPALMVATFFENTKEILDLLDKGADVNAVDENGWTALATAGNYIIELKQSFLEPIDTFIFLQRLEGMPRWYGYY